jgi:hypothetical protein
MFPYGWIKDIEKSHFMSTRKSICFCKGFGMNIAGKLPVSMVGNLSSSAFGARCFAQKMSNFSRKIKQGG